MCTVCESACEVSSRECEDAFALESTPGINRGGLDILSGSGLNLSTGEALDRTAL